MDALAICPNALKTSKEERHITTGEADAINRNFSPSSDCNLFKLYRSFRTYRAHFPSTITYASYNSMILTRGPCRPRVCLKKMEVGDLFSLKSTTSVSLLEI